MIGYNTILGVLACAKAISTYCRKMRRRSHPALLQIIVRYVAGGYIYIGSDPTSEGPSTITLSLLP